MPKYNIGDKVWYCNEGTREIHITCPDCLGSGRLEVIMGDGSHVGIDCECCRHGYEHLGWITDYEWSAEVIKGEVAGMEINGNKVEYHIGTPCSYRNRREDQIFTTEEEAKVQAEIAKAEWEIANQQEFQRKVKGNKNWAFNASYHRSCLKDALKQMEYHTKKLEIAKVKAKEPKEVDVMVLNKKSNK